MWKSVGSVQPFLPKSFVIFLLFTFLPAISICNICKQWPLLNYTVYSLHQHRVNGLPHNLKIKIVKTNLFFKWMFLLPFLTLSTFTACGIKVSMLLATSISWSLACWLKSFHSVYILGMPGWPSCPEAYAVPLFSVPGKVKLTNGSFVKSSCILSQNGFTSIDESWIGRKVHLKIMLRVGPNIFTMIIRINVSKTHCTPFTDILHLPQFHHLTSPTTTMKFNSVINYIDIF